MAVLALSTDLADMRERLGRMVIGNSKSGGLKALNMPWLSIVEPTATIVGCQPASVYQALSLACLL
jgi:hypothetical protein